MKRDQSAYLRGYYKKNRPRIRQKQRQGYEAKYERVSIELLRHLQANPMHALGRPEIICSECERLGPVKPVVCIEDGCGRMGLRQCAAHVGAIHRLSIGAYKQKWGYRKRESITSPQFHRDRSELSSTDASLGRLNPHHFPSKKKSGRAAESLRDKATPSRFQGTLLYWPIASECLKGRERCQIAADLDMWANTVNRCCRAMHFPSRPVRFWRGEPVSERHVHNLMRDFDLSEVAIAKLTNLPVHQIRRALAQKRKGRPLTLDVADRLINLRARLQETRRHTTLQAEGRPTKLAPSELQEIPWKYRVLLKEMRNLWADLPVTVDPIAINTIGECLCKLAQSGKVNLLLFWARPFLAWLRQEHDLNREALASPATAAKEFLAAQYEVSEETIEKRLTKKSDHAFADDLKRRQLLVDIDIVMGGDSRLPTKVLLARLPQLRERWRRLNHSRMLAALLKPIAIQPTEWRVGKHVVRGYRREDLGIYSTEEAAAELGITMQGLKQWIKLRKIPVPPVVNRSGVRGRGSVRLWTKADITAIKTCISIQPRTVFRPAPSATADAITL